jgi:hypothetical protein
MKRNSLIFFCILTLLFGSLPYSSAEKIPEEIQKLGFTQSALIAYEKQGSEEFYTFWLNEESGDTITFIVENGKIKQTSRGEAIRSFETNNF